MDRDPRTVVLPLVQALLLASTIACQQTDGREAAGDVNVMLPTTPPPIATADRDLQRAQVELSDGRGTSASRIVMPVLRVPERRTPEALLIAARAASSWGGWNLVHATLAFEPWIGTRFDGEALELLALSALERGAAAQARDYAEAALRVRSPPAARAVRLVLLARALDRLDQTDSAAATYRRAAQALPMIREWLLLRAAGSLRDAGARQEVYEDVREPAARGRVAHTEAQTLERFGLAIAAATAYEKLGDIPSSYRLRLSSDYDAAQRATVRAGLLGYLQRDARGENLQRGVEVLDAAFPNLDPATELLVARVAAEGGLHARAASGFAKVPRASLTDADVLAWGRALMAASRPAEAASRLAARRFGPVAAPEGMYLRGVALVRSRCVTAARPVLQRVATSYRTSRYAADALFLLADLDSDAGREPRARDLFARSCLSQPAGSYSDNACFRSGILSLILGNASRAASAFDELLERFPNSSEAQAARYWSGRALERLGNVSAARQRWGDIVQRQPLSYYAIISARRLGLTPWMPPPAALPAAPQLRGALNRARVLAHLGMDVEARHELDFVESDAGDDRGKALASGAALVEYGEVPRAIRLGWKALGARGDSAAADTRAYGLIYPLLREIQLLGRARANNLDPAVVAAVIRQESSWYPRAVSRAGARGLMQIMPEVGEAIARARGYTFWDPAFLFDPDVSLELGTAHLRAAISSANSLPRALAAYNAGESRLRRWVRQSGVHDPEMFVERIPFVETRDYVRIVLRNAEIYRALHGLRR